MLLAEDSDDLRSLFTVYLKMYGAEVTAVINGKDALEAYKNADFDVVLLDFFMPKMNGDEVMDKIAEDGEHPPVIVLTANAMKDAKRECLSKGFDGYLSKPIQQETIVAAVLDYAEKRK